MSTVCWSSIMRAFPDRLSLFRFFYDLDYFIFVYRRHIVDIWIISPREMPLFQNFVVQGCQMNLKWVMRACVWRWTSAQFFHDGPTTLRSFRIFDSQMSPVMLILFHYFVIIVFVPIFDRCVSFGLRRNGTSIFHCSSGPWPLVRLFTFCCFQILHSNIKTKSGLFEALFEHLLWCHFGVILLPFCAQTWTNKYRPQPKRDISCRRVLSGWSRGFVNRKGCSLMCPCMHLNSSTVVKWMSPTANTYARPICAWRHMRITYIGRVEYVNESLSMHAFVLILPPWR